LTPCSIDFFTRLPNPRDDVPDRHRRPFRHDDLQELTVSARDQLHHCFIGLDLGERVAGFYGVAFLLGPLHEAPFLHRGRQRLHVNFGGHDRD